MRTAKIRTSWYTVFAVGILTISILATDIPSKSAPPGRMFLPSHNGTIDYPLYVSFIRQGIEGRSRVSNLFAYEPHKPTFLYSFYLVLGRIGRLFGTSDAHVVYQASRIGLAVLWVWALYRCITYFVPDEPQRIIAYALSLFSSSFPWFSISDGSVTTGWFMTWWTELDPIRRATFLPHYLAGHILLVTAIAVFVQVHRSGKMRNLVWSIAAGLIAGFIHPASLMILTLILPLWGMWERNMLTVTASVIFLLATAPSLLLINSASQRYPWSVGRGFESLSFTISGPDFLLALGPILPLAGMALVLFFFPKLLQINRLIYSNEKNLPRYQSLLGLWAIVSISLTLNVLIRPPLNALSITRFLPISNIRFLQVVVWVPLAILSSYTLVFLRDRFGKKLFTGILVLLAVLTFVGYPQSFAAIRTERFAINPFQTPEVTWFEAIRTMDDIVPQDGVVLSLPFAGNFIPSYTGATVYVGHRFMTPDFVGRLEDAWSFYRGKTEACEAYRFLRDRRVTHVFYGFDEQQAGESITGYGFLEPVIRKGTTTVYAVNPKHSLCL